MKSQKDKQMLAPHNSWHSVCSVFAAGKVTMPRAASYCASKFALDGFFSSMRQELQSDNLPVTITVCNLGSVRTSIVT